MGKNTAQAHKNQETSVNQGLTNCLQKAAELFLLPKDRLLEGSGDSYELNHKA